MAISLPSIPSVSSSADRRGVGTPLESRLNQAVALPKEPEERLRCCSIFVGVCGDEERERPRTFVGEAADSTMVKLGARSKKRETPKSPSLTRRLPVSRKLEGLMSRCLQEDRRTTDHRKGRLTVWRVIV